MTIYCACTADRSCLPHKETWSRCGVRVKRSLFLSEALPFLRVSVEINTLQKSDYSQSTPRVRTPALRETPLFRLPPCHCGLRRSQFSAVSLSNLRRGA